MVKCLILESGTREASWKKLQIESEALQKSPKKSMRYVIYGMGDKKNKLQIKIRKIQISNKVNGVPRFFSNREM